MDIDAPLAHGIQEHNNDTSNYHNNSSSHVYHSESSMNFDYLQGLRADAAAASTSSAASGSGGSNNAYGVVDDSRALDRLLFLTTYKTTSQHFYINNDNIKTTKKTTKYQIDLKDLIFV